MIKKFLLGLIISICFVQVSTQHISAVGVGDDCDHRPRQVGDPKSCDNPGYSCQVTRDPNRYTCQLTPQPCTQLRLGCATNPRGIPGINCRGVKDDTGQCVIQDVDRDCDACPAAFDPTKPATPPDFSLINLFGRIQPPDPLKKFIGTDPTGTTGLSKFLSNLIVLFYTVATVVLIFMILWGAFDWLTSGGDKEKIQSARNKIVNSLIGFILFAVAFAIISVVGTFTGFKFFTTQNIKVERDGNGNITKIVCPDGRTFGGVAGSIDPSLCN